MIKGAITAHFKGNYETFYSKYLPQARKIGGDEWQALCPFHDDKVPSLNFNALTGSYYCHGCGKKGWIVHFYAKINNLDTQRDFLKILNSIARDFGISVDDSGPRFVKAYDYTDAQGKPLFQVCRYDPKKFKQRRMNGTGKWIYNLEGVQRVLYRLPEVLKAAEVVIVEGEKDADTVTGLGFCGTTAPMGARKWRPEYSDSLKGKNVVLIPDNDQEGREHMTQVASALRAVAASLKWLDLSDVPSKGDVSDWVKRFGSKEEAVERLSILIDAAPPYSPPKVFTIEDAVMDSTGFCGINLPEKRSFLHPLITEHQIILVSGWRGTGKTWAGLSMADAITKRSVFGPWKVQESVPCLYLDGEMAAQDVRKRLALLCPADGREQPLYIYSDAYANTLGLPRANLLNESWRSTMKRILVTRHVRFFVVDNIASLAGGIDENSKKDWDPINAWLIDLRFAGITTMLLHHVGKEGSQRGTSSREDNIDLSIILKHPQNYQPENGADFIMSFSKTRVSHEDLSLIQETRFTLKQDEHGGLVWSWASVKAAVREETIRMLNQGFSYQDIMEALGISKGRISQIKRDAMEAGILDKQGKIIKGGI